MSKLGARCLDFSLKSDLLAHPRFYPHITSFQDESSKKTVKFEYLQYLEGSEVAFKAQVCETSELIVVKFAQRYGTEVHTLLQSSDLAPEIRCVQRLGSGYRNFDDSLLGWWMVVMDYVDGKTLQELYGPVTPIPKAIHDQVKKGLDIIWKERLVYGDLRRPNIMVDTKGAVKFIDFNWAGRKHDADVVYPALLSAGVKWASGAAAGSLILVNHDIQMLSWL